MRARSLYASAGMMMGLLCAAALCQSISDVMSDRVPWPFDHLTPENVRERLRPFIEEAENAQTEAEKARDYVFLTGVVEGRISNPNAQDLAIELADKALSCNLSPLDRADMLKKKGSAIRKMHGFAKGEALREPRREVMALWLEAYKVVLTYERTLEEEFRHDHPDFNPRPSLSEHVGRFNTVYNGRPPSPEEDEARRAWFALRRKYDSMQDAQADLEGLGNTFVDLYARAPYDLDELERLVTDIVGDAALAKDLVERTKKEIAARLRKRYLGDEKALFLESVNVNEIDAVSASSPAAGTPPPSAPAPSAAAPATADARADATRDMTPDARPDRKGTKYLLLISVGAAVILAAGIVLKRLSRRG